MRRQRANDHGAAAVEFALVLPLLMALVMGIIQYGWYFFVANNASAAAREGARRVVVGDCWGGAFEPYVMNQGLPGTITSASYTPADLAPEAVKVGDEVTITVTADTEILSYLPGVPTTLTRTFTARLEDKTGGCP